MFLIHSNVLGVASADINLDGQVDLVDLSVLSNCLSYLELRVREDGTLRNVVSRTDANQIVGIRSFGKDCTNRKHLDINLDKKNDRNDYWLLKSCLDFKALLKKGYSEEELRSLLQVDFKKNCQALFVK